MTAIEFLYSRQNLGIKLGLDRTYALMERVGSPHLTLPSVQVVGTNGKGSVSAMLSKIYETAGYKCGLSTSPHLVDVNERIRINGEPVPTEAIDEFIRRYRTDIEEVGSSFFETITAMAFWYFQKNSVDIAILETGLGGRLDSVSVCRPFATVMTSISMDHSEILGDTLEKIAGEKAGAMKRGVPCVSLIQKDPVKNVLLRRGAEIKSPVIWAEEPLPETIEVGIPGAHQRQNAALAVRTLDFVPLKVSESQIRKGLKEVKWYGRFQILKKQPLVVFDVAHNADGFSSFLEEYARYHIPGVRYLVFALQARKDISHLIPKLEEHFHHIVCTETTGGRHRDAEEMAGWFSKSRPVEVIRDSDTAVSHILDRMNDSDSLAILGSHYLGPAIYKNFELSFYTL